MGGSDRRVPAPPRHSRGTSPAATTVQAATGQYNGPLLPGQQQHHHRGIITGGGVTTALMYACQQGDVDAVRRILRDQPNSVTLRDRSGKSALHYTCQQSEHMKGATHTADLVTMAAPTLVDSRDSEGFAPLHLAVIAGNMQLVTFLLANGADVNAVDNEHHTVVHWATVCGETMALRAVLAAGAPVSTPDVHGGYPLHYAAQMCGGKDSQLGLEVLQALLTHPDISTSVADGDGRQPLLWAASAGSARAVLALVKAGAALEAPDRDGLTALHCAASRGHTETIDALLTLCGAATDVIDGNGCTALHYAVTLGHADATALLLAHGANPNRQDRKGRSPAHCGCAKGQFETVRMLAAGGAGNLWLRNARGDLPLHEAAASGRRPLVKWLLESRPSQVNARNNDGRCPLHLAALNDNADMCKVLLDHGAQINPILRTSKNVLMTPLDCALQRGFRSTAKYLQVHGGVPANRVGTTTQVTATVQIQEDGVLWDDDTTDSEREHIEGKDPALKKPVRRKIAYKYERQVEDGNVISDEDYGEASGTFKKGGKLAESSEQLKVEEVVGVPEKVSKSKLLKPTFSDKRPKSAKARQKTKSAQSTADSAKKKTKIDTPDPRRKDNVFSTLKPSDGDSKETNNNVTVTNVKENIKSIDNLAQTIEENAKSIREEVHSLTTKHKQQDEHSLMSNTSLEEDAKKLVVEASVHSPPKESNEEILQSIKLVLEKEMRETIARYEQTKRDEEKNEDKGYIEVIKSLKDELEGIKCEIKGMREEGKILERVTKEAMKEDIKEDIKGEIVEDIVIDIVESKGDKDNIEKDKEIVDIVTEVITNVEAISADDVKSTTVEDLLLGEGVNMSTNIEEELEKRMSKIKESAAESNVMESLKVDEQDSKITAECLMAALSPVMIGSVGAEDKDKVEKVEESIVAPGEVVEENEVKENELKVGDETVTEASGEIPEEKAAEKVEAEVEEAQETEVPQDGADIKENEETKDKKRSFLKSAKKQTQLDVDTKSGQVRDSSIEPKSTDEDSSSTSTGSTTKREHKSFTVLGENELVDRTRKPIRSKSEEARLARRNKTTSNSKIPTPVGAKLSKTTGLSKSERNLSTKKQKHLETTPPSRIPSLPNLNGAAPRSASNMSAPLLQGGGEYSDEDVVMGEEVGDADPVRSSSSRKRLVKKRSKGRATKSAANSDYESSNLIDSGFEPSPRSVKVPRGKNVSNRGVNMTSVTQSIQTNIRRYHLERKIFQHLLDLKRMQIRSGQHNEHMLVKRAIETYHRSCAATVGAGRYHAAGDLSFKSFEKFLYNSLRKLQQQNGGAAGVDNLRGLPVQNDNIVGGGMIAENPLHCTQSTHRCAHATHAYTGIPCAAYLPMMDHHSIPKIGFDTDCKPSSGGFLPNIKKQQGNGTNTNGVTLELCHGGADKQVISLPTDRLDQNKRYYVTFTVKGQEKTGENGDENTLKVDEQSEQNSHRHAKSV